MKELQREVTRLHFYLCSVLKTRIQNEILPKRKYICDFFFGVSYVDIQTAFYFKSCKLSQRYIYIYIYICVCV